MTNIAKSWTNEVEQLLLPYVEKPAGYLGGEYNSIEKNWEELDATMAFLFPDTYEIGMSHLGTRILYEVVNKHPKYCLERCFAPLVDMEKLMREHKIPLFTWENYHSVADFDVVGITLQYEMSYTNIMNMIDLAGMPIVAQNRQNWEYPLLVAGGSCAYNAEPLAEIFDLFILGEGEEIEIELLDLYTKCRKENKTKDEFLVEACQLGGIYVPKFYTPVYDGDKIVDMEITNDAPKKVLKRIIKDLDNVVYPTSQMVPFTQIVHDRAVIEIMRGCNRGCRFCQAGIIYRPVREKSLEVLRKQAAEAVKNTGYDEIGILSLSTADYSCVGNLIDELMEDHKEKGVSVSLPSLRVDAMSVGLAQKVQQVRKSGMTFAPEGGTQRIRDVINKGVTEEDIMAAVESAIANGWSGFKLYFMAGLPFETEEDLLGIAETTKRIMQKAKETARLTKGRPININVSVAFFVPKPHTPFQWYGQNDVDTMLEKRELLYQAFKEIKGARLNCHDTETSFLEAVFSRGDRRLGQVLLEANRLGCKFDGWYEHFNYEKWMEAFENCGIKPEDYAERVFEKDEILPWDHLDVGANKKWLWHEWQKAEQAVITADCRKGPCSGCGVCQALDCDNIYIK